MYSNSQPVGSRLSGVCCRLYLHLCCWPVWKHAFIHPSIHPFIHSFLQDQRQSPKQRQEGHVMWFVIEILQSQESRQGFVSGVVGRAAYAVCRCVQSTGFQRLCLIILTVSANVIHILRGNALLKLSIHVHRVFVVAQLKYRIRD